MSNGFFGTYVPVNVAVLFACQQFHERRRPTAAAENAKFKRGVKKILSGHKLTY
jgi:hypothetical protein